MNELIIAFIPGIIVAIGGLVWLISNNKEPIGSIGFGLVLLGFLSGIPMAIILAPK